MDFRSTNFILKAITAPFIVPMGFIVALWWPWWEKKEWGTKKVLTGIFLVPIWGIMFVAGAWWDGL